MIYRHLLLLKSSLALIIIMVFLPFQALCAPPPWVDLPDTIDYFEIPSFKDPRFDALSMLMQQYHSYPKDSLKHMPDRIDALNNIINYFETWLKDDLQANNQKHLRDMKEISENKRNYLVSLQKKINNNEFTIENFQKYQSNIENILPSYKPISLVNRRLYDSANGQFWGEFWIETLDPCHRQLTPYHDLWRRISGENFHKDKLGDFFLWLETQNLSKDVPFMEYLDEKTLTSHTVIVKNGLMYFPYDIGNHKIINYDNKDNEYIFNIDTLGRLIYIPASKTVHHVSMSHGKAVLGCGNMLVRKGKIISIELESGHYLPTIDDGMQTLKIMHEMGISIDPNTKFSYYNDSGKVKTTVSRFMQAFSQR